MITIAKKKTKKSGALVLVILLVIVAIGTAAVFMIAMRPPPRPDEAIAEFTAIDLESLRDELLALDMEHDYPVDPEDVMRLFNQTFWLIYNWDMDDTYTILRVLQVQRELYSQALYDLNPINRQLSRLLFSIEEQHRARLELIGIHQGQPVPDRFNPQDRATISIIRYMMGGQSFHYDFHMFKRPDSGRWEIGFWVETVQ